MGRSAIWCGTGLEPLVPGCGCVTILGCSRLRDMIMLESWSVQVRPGLPKGRECGRGQCTECAVITFEDYGPGIFLASALVLMVSATRSQPSIQAPSTLASNGAELWLVWVSACAGGHFPRCLVLCAAAEWRFFVLYACMLALSTRHAMGVHGQEHRHTTTRDAELCPQPCPQTCHWTSPCRRVHTV